MPKIVRILKRVSVLGPAEVMHRIIELCYIRILHIRFSLGLLEKKYRSISSANYAFCLSSERQLPSLPFSEGLDDNAKISLLEGKCAALGFPWQWSESADCWSYAPDTGRSWPSAVFFTSIFYFSGNPYGDVRVAWEPSRLQQLVSLGLVATDDEEVRAQALDMMRDILQSWVKYNPPASGIHYFSAMECALRILSVTHALDMVRPYIKESSGLWQAATLLVKSHADLIEHRLSLHSSLGNHTTAECVGLIYAAVLFPEFPEARRWMDKGLGILQQEASHQVLPDGGGIEGSPWYHVFVLDLLGLTEELLSFRDISVPHEISMATIRGKAFIGSLAESPGQLIRLNDADDGFALSPYLRLSWTNISEPGPLITYPDSGITRVALGHESNSFLMLSHGPLGMAPLYAHSHADSLVVSIRHNGIDLAVDPGTYMYTGGPAWRAYFRSTKAHNTLCIDGRDQARQVTPFQWSRPYSAVLVRSEIDEFGTIRLLARHDGYAESGIIHWRSIVVVPEKFVVVHDLAQGHGVHELDLHWHIEGELCQTDSGLRSSLEGSSARISVHGGELSLHSGEIDPVCGWRSLMYGEKHSISTIRASYKGNLPHKMITIFEFDDHDVSQDLVDSCLQPVCYSTGDISGISSQ